MSIPGRRRIFFRFVNIFLWAIIKHSEKHKYWIFVINNNIEGRARDSYGKCSANKRMFIQNIDGIPIKALKIYGIYNVYMVSVLISFICLFADLFLVVLLILNHLLSCMEAIWSLFSISVRKNIIYESFRTKTIEAKKSFTRSHLNLRALKRSSCSSWGHLKWWP